MMDLRETNPSNNRGIKMYIITFKKKPATLEKLFNVEKTQMSWRIGNEERASLLASKSKSGVVALYIYYFGFTWKERPKGVDFSKVELSHG